MSLGAALRLNTIGSFVFSDGDTSYRITRRKAQALLTRLWLQPNHTESRSRLANLLWSRSGETDARASLRQELSRLNKELAHCRDAPVLAGDKFSIWLVRKPGPSDAEDLLSDLETGTIPYDFLEKTLLHEDFLVHLEGIDPELDLWITVERSSFSRKCIRLLKTIMNNERYDASTKEVAARALLNLDPTDETACRQLMEFAIARNDRASALARFRETSELLWSKYAVEPSQELGGLARAIQNGDSLAADPERELSPARPNTSADPGHSPKILLLVHPPQTMNADATAHQRFVVLRSELIGALSRFRDWSVREFSATDGRTASYVPNGKVYELTISGDAGGDGDFLTFNLIAVDTRDCLWSESFEIDYSRLAGQKREAIRKLATALNVEISAHRLSQILSSNEAQLDIYDRWLLGASLLLDWRPEAEAKAETAFRSILAQEETFAPAIAGLVQILNTRHHIFPGVTRDRAREAEALVLARRASRLAPHDCRTQLTLAWCYLMNDEIEQSIHYYKLALEINDNDPWTLISAAQGLCYAGEKVQAIELAETAMNSGRCGEPMHWAYAACIRFHIGSYGPALDAITRANGAAYFVDGMQVAILGHIGNNAAITQASDHFQTRVTKAWTARLEPTRKNIRSWFLQLFPIQREADREHLEAGLDKAGFGLA